MSRKRKADEAELEDRHDPLRWLPRAFNQSALVCTDDTNTRDLAYIAALDALHRRHRRTKANPSGLTKPLGLPVDSVLLAVRKRLNPKAQYYDAGARCTHCITPNRTRRPGWRPKHAWMGCFSWDGKRCSCCAANRRYYRYFPDPEVKVEREVNVVPVMEEELRAKGRSCQSPSPEPEVVGEAEWKVAMARREKEVQAQMARWKESEPQRTGDSQRHIARPQEAGACGTQSRGNPVPPPVQRSPAVSPVPIGSLGALIAQLKPFPRSVRNARLTQTRSQTSRASTSTAPQSQPAAQLTPTAVPITETPTQSTLSSTQVPSTQWTHAPHPPQSTPTGLSEVVPQHERTSHAQTRTHSVPHEQAPPVQSSVLHVPYQLQAAGPSGTQQQVMTRPDSLPSRPPTPPFSEAPDLPELDVESPHVGSETPVVSNHPTPLQTALPSPALTTPSPSTQSVPLTAARPPQTSAFRPSSLGPLPSPELQVDSASRPPPPTQFIQPLVSTSVHQEAAGHISTPQQVTAATPTSSAPATPTPAPTPPTPLFQHVALLATGWQLLHRNLKVEIQYDEASETAELLKSVSAFSIAVQNAVAAGLVTGGEALQLQLKWDRIEHGLEDPSQLVYMAIADRLLADAKMMQEAVKGIATVYGLGALVPDD